jgi:ABC-type transport system involved in multi-copper enzyme maturation permease subunit
MLNLLRSDFYRLFKGKTIYVTFAIVLAFMVLLPFMEKNTGYEVLIGGLGENDFILLALLPILFVIAAIDFQFGTIKNALSYGTSRTGLYFSKLILAGVYCIIMYLSVILVKTLSGTAFNGFQGEITSEILLSVLEVAGIQICLLLGAVSVGIAIIFMFQSSAVFCAVFATFFYGTLAILYGLSVVLQYPFTKASLLATMGAVSSIDSLTWDNVAHALSLAAVYIVGSAVLGILFSRKSEIK